VSVNAPTIAPGHIRASPLLIVPWGRIQELMLHHNKNIVSKCFARPALTNLAQSQHVTIMHVAEL
jgi:hypothetical protein